MNEARIERIIKRAREKTEKNLSVKNEIFALLSIYEYIKDDDAYKEIVSLLALELTSLNEYQEKRREGIK